jgi:hypothetical protein
VEEAVIHLERAIAADRREPPKPFEIPASNPFQAVATLVRRITVAARQPRRRC